MAFIIAEMSANHLGSFDRAKQIIEVAKQAGADAIKFQTWTKDTMCISDFIVPHGTWKGRNLKDLYKDAYTPTEWLPELFEYARKLEIVPMSSPFDIASVNALEEVSCGIYKVASFELVDIPLIAHIAKTGKPIIFSTGMATENEIGEAVVTAFLNGCRQMALLKCTSDYPADASNANLATLFDMQKYGVALGISDHSPGVGVAVAAVALGATIIEKHLTLSRSDGGPDASFSMEPNEFKQLVTECRRAEASIGKITYGGSEDSKIFRRSLWVKKEIKNGEVITDEHIVTARPALGLHPRFMQDIIGTVSEFDHAIGPLGDIGPKVG